MLRTNLSTRPFYNEQAVRLVLGLLGTVGLGLLVLGIVRMRSLAAEQGSLLRDVSEQEARITDTERQTAALQRELLPADIAGLSQATVTANALLARRAFSWTEFFNIIEARLPENVMLTSLRPAPEAETLRLVIGVVGKSQDAILGFVEQLESTDAFANILVRNEEILEEGGYRAVLDGQYLVATTGPASVHERTQLPASRAAVEPPV